jgi:hypothetical protein
MLVGQMQTFAASITTLQRAMEFTGLNDRAAPMKIACF